MSFAVGAEEYDRFMGRYSVPLATRFVEFAQVQADHRVIDVGCGPGALVAELIKQVPAEAVCAVDPSAGFVAAAGARYPGVRVEQAAAEELPFDDRCFDVALAQLVVHFMADPVKGLGEMARVTTTDGVVAACVWDHAGGGSPLSPFWDAARELDVHVEGEAQLAGAREGHLGELFAQAGLHDIEQAALHVDVEHPTFEDWWDPFLLGVGPAGRYAAGLDPARRSQLRELARAKFPAEPFVVGAHAWAARGRSS